MVPAPFQGFRNLTLSSLAHAKTHEVILRTQIIAVSIAVFAAIAVSCLLSLMVIFMGGGQVAPDLRGLMLLQAWAIPIEIIVIGFVIALFVAASGWRGGLKRLWVAMPQWLVFAFLLLNSLFVAGELAVIMVAEVTGEAMSLSEQIPLFSLLFSTLAVLMLAAWTYDGREQVLTGRWAPPHDQNREWPEDF